MSSLEHLKEFINERLTAAAEEIFGVFKRTIDEYEEELVRQRKMLAVAWKPEIKLLRTGYTLILIRCLIILENDVSRVGNGGTCNYLKLPFWFVSVPPEAPQDSIHEVKEEDLTEQQLWNPESSYDQNLEDLQIKEEQEEQYVHAEEQELLKQESDVPVLKSVDEKDDSSDHRSLDWNCDGTGDVVSMPVMTEPTMSNVCDPAADKNPLDPHTADRPFKCDRCKKDFKSKGDFQKHLRTHTGEKPYSCSFCSKNFSQRSSLNLHLRIHSGEKPYVCETCGKDFIQRSDLTIHIRRAHTGEKPYRCQICGKCFPANNDLTVHSKIHMVHKQFMCVTCGRGFRRGCQLTLHIRRDHNGEKRFICQICGKRYFNTYELSRHQRSHMKTTALDPDTIEYDFT